MSEFATRAKATWARLIRKAYEADPLECPKCKRPSGRETRSSPSPTTQSPTLHSAAREASAATLAPRTARSPHASQDSRHFDLTGIAIGRAQAQYPLGAVLGGAESAPNRSHRPDARNEAGLTFLSFDVVKIQQIADKYDIKVIYDAAHAFGVKFFGESLLVHGDCSTLSFHATKQFHTAEGGAVVCKGTEVAKRVFLMKKFGHIGEENYLDVGINAKMSELHAAMGLQKEEIEVICNIVQQPIP